MKMIKRITLLFIFIIITSLSFYTFEAKTYGGEQLTDAKGYKSCTAGYNTVNPSTGQKYLVTAGHCFKEGEDVYDLKTMEKIGTVEKNFLSPYSISTDVEFIKLIDNTDNPYIFDGKSNQPTPVVSYMSEDEYNQLINKPVVRRKYVYFAYSQRENKIYPLSFYKEIDQTPNGEVLDPPVLEFVGKSGYFGSGQVYCGDSGAPVYSYSDAGIELVGIVNGANRTYVDRLTRHIIVHPVYYSAPIYKPQTI